MAVTSIRAEVLFPSLATAKCRYIPRVKLFKTEWVDLKGNWTKDSIKNYCNRAALKQGYKNTEINVQITFENEDYYEDLNFICN